MNLECGDDAKNDVQRIDDMAGDRLVNILRISITIVAAVLLVLLTADGAGGGMSGASVRDTFADDAGRGETLSSQIAETTAVTSAATSSEESMPAQDAALAVPRDIPPGERAGETTDEQSNVMSAEHLNDPSTGQPEETPGGQHAATSAGTTVNAGDPGEQRIAYITIDDGPSRAITPGMLDILAQEGIKATFFVLPHGGMDDIYRRIIDEGHEIGNHSYSHVYSRLYNSDDLETFREDVLRARDYILDNFGYETTTFRFPGGMMGRNSEIVAPRRVILEEIGYRYFDWNSDTGDAGRSADKSAAALTNNVLRNTLGRERLIVIMHDTADKATTLEALPMIIAGLREQGYVFDVLRNYDTPNPSVATETSLARVEDTSG